MWHSLPCRSSGDTVYNGMGHANRAVLISSHGRFLKPPIKIFCDIQQSPALLVQHNLRGYVCMRVCVHAYACMCACLCVLRLRFRAHGLWCWSGWRLVKVLSPPPQVISMCSWNSKPPMRSLLIQHLQERGGGGMNTPVFLKWGNEGPWQLGNLATAELTMLVSEVGVELGLLCGFFSVLGTYCLTQHPPVPERLPRTEMVRIPAFLCPRILRNASANIHPSLQE